MQTKNSTQLPVDNSTNHLPIDHLTKIYHLIRNSNLLHKINFIRQSTPVPKLTLSIMQLIN